MNRASVILEEYNSSWPEKFKAEKEHLKKIAGKWNFGSIEHVGSTAAPRGIVTCPCLLPKNSCFVKIRDVKMRRNSMTENRQQKITGECFCGELKYKIDDQIQDATFCHCSRCRKAFGGAGSSFSMVRDGTFSWISGESNLQTYVGKEGWGIGFCKKCGSTLCGIYENKVAGISIGTLNNDPTVKIQRHIYVGSKTCWDEIGGDAPQFVEAEE